MPHSSDKAWRALNAALEQDIIVLLSSSQLTPLPAAYFGRGGVLPQDDDTRTKIPEGLASEEAHLPRAERDLYSLIKRLQHLLAHPAPGAARNAAHWQRLLPLLRAAPQLCEEFSTVLEAWPPGPD